MSTQTEIQRRRYLFEPGQYGFTPDTLSRPNGHHRITAESGRDFIFHKSPHLISIYDPDINTSQNRFEGILRGEIKNRGLRFFIFPSEPYMLFFHRRIKDLNPSGFIDLALEHFDKLGTSFAWFIADMVKGKGVTYDQYAAVLAQTGDKVTAADSTWIGKQAVRNGFRIKTPEDVYEVDDPDNPFNPSIEALYSRV